MIKRLIALVVCLTICFSCFGLIGCGEEVLNVYNCYEYIDETLLEDFGDYYEEKTGKKIKVVYTCFDTPEDAYNNLKINPKGYDLICPSDYMIEKMAREDMLQKFTMDENGYYMQNVSPYIKDVFKSIKWNDTSLADYAVGYMWGTLGLVYNPEKVSPDDMNSWSILWESKYSGHFSIKDSVRDTYFICLAKHYNSELLSAKEAYEKGGSLADYQSKLKEIFNDTSTSTVEAVKTSLTALGTNCSNFEVDEGKDDISKGVIDINFAWSGDAVYALDLGDENGFTLEYYVPDEGSNVWFDGWVIPKQSTKVEEAKMFLDFISKPENVMKNMDYIGYTSVIAGDTIFNDFVVENYDEEEGDEVDLSYFFGDGDYVITTSETRRQFYTQYPSQDVINRCTFMSYFPTEANERINDMWIAVKSNIN